MLASKGYGRPQTFSDMKKAKKIEGSPLAVYLRDHTPNQRLDYEVETYGILCTDERHSKVLESFATKNTTADQANRRTMRYLRAASALRYYKQYCDRKRVAMVAG